MVICDREDYLKEPLKKLKEEDVYEQFPNDSNVLANTYESIRRKLLQSDLSRNALYHSSNKDPIYVRCYFPPKVHKWLYNVSV